MIYLVVIAIYFAIVITIGVLSRRKAKRIDDFLVAGRKGSPVLITGSLLATVVGGSATIGMAGLGFSRGLTGAWWLLVGCIGLVASSLLFAGKVRGYGLYTLPELVEKQYDRRVGLAASLLIVIAWLGVLAAQIIASARIMGILGMVNPDSWMIIFTVIIIVYGIIGGQQAIIKTDIIQIVIVLAGIVTCLAMVMLNIGGWEGLTAAIPAGHLEFPLSPDFGVGDLTSLMLLVGLTYMVGPDIYSRLFCARDERTARVSLLWSALIMAPVAFAITIIGMGALALFPHIASSEQAFPVIIGELLPPWAGGIVLAALLGAVMSSADTILFSAATIMALDIVGHFRPVAQRGELFRSRWSIVCLGAIALMLALVLEGVIEALLFAYTVYTAGLIVPVIAGFYRDRFKLTPTGALAAITGGGGVALASRILDIKYLDLGSLAVSLALLFLVSHFETRYRDA